MNKTNTSYFFAGLFIGLVIVGGIFAMFQPTPNMQESEKMQECIKAGGEFSIYDWSLRLRDDGSDYRATCRIPEQKLWQVTY